MLPFSSGSREGKLLADISGAFKDSNVEAFTDAVYNYDQISKIDPWKTVRVQSALCYVALLLPMRHPQQSVLLKIKTAMQKAAGDGDDLT